MVRNCKGRNSRVQCRGTAGVAKKMMWSSTQTGQMGLFGWTCGVDIGPQMHGCMCGDFFLLVCCLPCDGMISFVHITWSLVRSIAGCGCGKYDKPKQTTGDGQRGRHWMVPTENDDHDLSASLVGDGIAPQEFRQCFIAFVHCETGCWVKVSR